VTAAEFVIQRRVQFAETDLAGVLHFANYYRMMEEVEHAFWRSLGESVMSQDGEGSISWPRVVTSCEYHAPARFEDVLELAFQVVGIGAQSLTFEVEFRREGQCIARGRIKAVCCRMVGGEFRSTAIPAPLREKLTAGATGAK
jgi:YbgC/YbaW family acyl-CoA thioester hydrolase